VTSFPKIDAIRQRVEQKLGPIDILVANAGGSFTRPGPLEEITEERWRASLDGNLRRAQRRRNVMFFRRGRASCHAQL
jgi:3-oxoacyl-[acyl-carrier protein] reductase